MQITDNVEKILDEFSQYTDWEDRYRHIIKLGRSLDAFSEESQVEKYRIKGCQSQVWLRPSLEQGKVILNADSDSSLVKGIIALLVKVYSGNAPEDILKTPPNFLKELGITEHLSMNRTNGLASMVKQIQMYATLFDAMVKKGVLDANP